MSRYTDLLEAEQAQLDNQQQLLDQQTRERYGLARDLGQDSLYETQLTNPNEGQNRYLRTVRSGLADVSTAALMAKSKAAALMGNDRQALDYLKQAEYADSRAKAIAPQDSIGLTDVESFDDLTQVIGEGLAGSIVPAASMAIGAIAGRYLGRAGGSLVDKFLGTASKELLTKLGTSAGVLAGGAVPFEAQDAGVISQIRPELEARYIQDQHQRAASGEGSFGKVLKVIDGDTLLVQPEDGGDPQYIRMAGYNSPDSGQEGKQRSAEALQAMLPADGRIQILADSQGVHGRDLAQVYAPGQYDLSINERMMQGGTEGYLPRYANLDTYKSWMAENNVGPAYANRFTSDPMRQDQLERDKINEFQGENPRSIGEVYAVSTLKNLVSSKLNTFAPMRGLGRVGNIAEKELLKRVGKNALRTMVEEVPTEAAQEFNDILFEKYVQGMSLTDFTSDDETRLLNTLVSAPVSAIFGGISGIPGQIRSRKGKFENIDAPELNQLNDEIQQMKYELELKQQEGTLLPEEAVLYQDFLKDFQPKSKEVGPVGALTAVPPVLPETSNQKTQTYWDWQKEQGAELRNPEVVQLLADNVAQKLAQLQDRTVKVADAYNEKYRSMDPARRKQLSARNEHQNTLFQQERAGIDELLSKYTASDAQGNVIATDPEKLLKSAYVTQQVEQPNPSQVEPVVPMRDLTKRMTKAPTSAALYNVPKKVQQARSLSEAYQQLPQTKFKDAKGKLHTMNTQIVGTDTNGKFTHSISLPNLLNKQYGNARNLSTLAEGDRQSFMDALADRFNLAMSELILDHGITPQIFKMPIGALKQKLDNKSQPDLFAKELARIVRKAELAAPEDTVVWKPGKNVQQQQPVYLRELLDHIANKPQPTKNGPAETFSPVDITPTVTSEIEQLPEGEPVIPARAGANTTHVYGNDLQQKRAKEFAKEGDVTPVNVNNKRYYLSEKKFQQNLRKAQEKHPEFKNLQNKYLYENQSVAKLKNRLKKESDPKKQAGIKSQIAVAERASNKDTAQFFRWLYKKDKDLAKKYQRVYLDAWFGDSLGKDIYTMQAPELNKIMRQLFKQLDMSEGVRTNPLASGKVNSQAKPQAKPERKKLLKNVAKGEEIEVTFTDNPILSKEGTPIVAKRVGKDIILSGDVDLWQKYFDEKRWTKPRELLDHSIAQALPENQFKTLKELRNFVILHEFMHTKFSKRPSETVGEYETRINRLALQKQGLWYDRMDTGTKELERFDIKGQLNTKQKQRLQKFDVLLRELQKKLPELKDVKLVHHKTLVDSKSPKGIMYAGADANIIGINPIALSGEYTTDQLIPALLHEVGHHVQYKYWTSTPKDVQKKLKAEFKRQRKLGAKHTTTLGTMGTLGGPLESTTRSFTEWYAEQVNSWLQENKKPRNVIQRHFKRFVDKIKEIYRIGNERQEGTRTTETMQDFMDSIWLSTEETVSEQASKMNAKAEVLASMLASPEREVRAKAMHKVIQTVLTPEERNKLFRAFTSKLAVKQLKKHLKPAWVEHAEQHPEELIVQSYLLWREGKLQLGSQTQGIFKRVMSWAQEQLGIISKSKQAEDILRQVTDATAETLADKMNNPFLHVYGRRQLTDTAAQKIVHKARETAQWPVELFKKGFFPAYERIDYKGNPALRKLVNMLHARVGTRVSETLQEGIMNRTEKLLNEMYKELETFSKTNMDAWGKAMRTGIDSKDPKIQLAVKKARAIHEAMASYRVKAGVRGTNRKGTYHTVSWNIEAINKDATEFDNRFEHLKQKHKEKLERIVKANKNAQAVAEAKKELKSLPELTAERVRWILNKYDGMMDTDQMTDKLVHSPFSGSDLGRELGLLNEETDGRVLMEQFQDQDYLTTMTKYIKQSVRKAEFARRFGGEESIEQELTSLMEKARQYGMTDEQEEVVTKTIEAQLGISGYDISPKARKAMGWMITAMNVALLPFVTLASIVDPINLALRTRGDTKALKTGVKQGLTEVKESVKNANKQGFAEQARDLLGIGGTKTKENRTRARELAETVGAVEARMGQEVLKQLYGNSFLTGKQRAVNDKFFQLTGIEAWTRMTRTAAVAAAEEFIKNNATNRKWMAELGLKEGDVRKGKPLEILSTAQWLEAQKNKDWKRIEKSERLEAAINRWVDQTMLRPKAMIRPLWFNDPRFMLISYLKDFQYAVFETTLRQLWYTAKGAGGVLPDTKIKLGSKEIPVSSGLGLSLAVALSYGPVFLIGEIIRDAIQHPDGEDPRKKNWTWLDHLRNSYIRAGLMGPTEALYDVSGELERDQVPLGAFLGPAYDITRKGVSAVTSDKEGTLINWFQNMLPANSVWKYWGDE